MRLPYQYRSHPMLPPIPTAILIPARVFSAMAIFSAIASPAGATTLKSLAVSPVLAALGVNGGAEELTETDFLNAERLSKDEVYRPTHRTAAGAKNYKSDIRSGPLPIWALEDRHRNWAASTDSLHHPPPPLPDVVALPWRRRRAKRNGVSRHSKLWPNARIPYAISTHYTTHERALLARAVKQYHDKTCLRFTPRAPHEGDYLFIGKIDGCFSEVGRTSGVQVLSLDNGCMEYSTIIHEIMHVVGFYHEHERWDRDQYIDIIWQNIDNGERLSRFEMWTMRIGCTSREVLKFRRTPSHTVPSHRLLCPSQPYKHSKLRLHITQQIDMADKKSRDIKQEGRSSDPYFIPTVPQWVDFNNLDERKSIGDRFFDDIPDESVNAWKSPSRRSPPSSFLVPSPKPRIRRPSTLAEVLKMEKEAEMRRVKRREVPAPRMNVTTNAVPLFSLSRPNVRLAQPAVKQSYQRHQVSAFEPTLRKVTHTTTNTPRKLTPQRTSVAEPVKKPTPSLQPSTSNVSVVQQAQPKVQPQVNPIRPAPAAPLKPSVPPSPQVQQPVRRQVLGRTPSFMAPTNASQAKRVLPQRNQSSVRGKDISAMRKPKN